MPVQLTSKFYVGHVLVPVFCLFGTTIPLFNTTSFRYIYEFMVKIRVVIESIDGGIVFVQILRKITFM